MTIRFSRLHRGQTRYYIAQNLTNRDDQSCIGGWYFNVH